MPSRQARPRPLAVTAGPAGGLLGVARSPSNPCLAEKRSACNSAASSPQRARWTPGGGQSIREGGSTRVSPPGAETGRRTCSTATLATAGRSALAPRSRPQPAPAPMGSLAASALGRQRSKTETGPGDFEFAPQKVIEEARPSTPPAMHLRAAILAPRFRLDTREVLRILKAFGSATDGVSLEAFHAMMCEIFEVEEVRRETLQSAYEATDCREGLDANKFLAWYVQNMFTEVSQLKASPDQLQGNDRLEQLARKHRCSVSTVDRVRRCFDRFDRDASGGLDFEEFLGLMPDLLKAPRSSIGENRIRQFFSEADRNGNGILDFPEFAAWYLKSFDLEDSDRDLVGPAEAILASYQPCVQRRRQLLERRRSI